MESNGPPVGRPAPGESVKNNHLLQSLVRRFSTSESASRNWFVDFGSHSLGFWLDALQAEIADRTADFFEPHSVMSIIARARLQLGQPRRNTIRPHGLPGDLVVSLTSHPRRFRTLALTLRSLLQQTVQADHIILWLTRADLRLLPNDVLDLRAAGLEIHVAEDLKSYTKMLPALQAFPDAFICTADDDTYYWPTWLQELVDAYDANDPTVTCHRAHGITVDRHGRPNPYSEWQRHVRPRGKAMHLFPTGCMGVLYPPGTLDHNADDRAIALEQCPLADDIWLYWIGQRNRAQYKTVGRRRHQITWPGSQQGALWTYNAKGGNDLQIRHLAEQYGYPSILKKIAEVSHCDSTKPTLTVAPELSAWAGAKP